MADGIVGFGKAMIGLATSIYLFFLLPVCFLGFDWLTGYRFIDRSRKFRDWAVLTLAVGAYLFSWVIWRFVLPDWWIAATPIASGEY